MKRTERESYEKILIAPISRFDMLFKCTHESMARAHTLFDLGVVNLEQQAVLARHRILDLCDLVTWTANLDELFLGRCCPRRRLLCKKLGLVYSRVLRIPRRSPCKIGLMLLSVQSGKKRDNKHEERKADASRDEEGNLSAYVRDSCLRLCAESNTVDIRARQGDSSGCRDPRMGRVRSEGR
jgi:hypothetical protein